MAKRDGFSTAEQWTVLLGPVAVLLGLMWLTRKQPQDKPQATKGLGDCGCGCNGTPGGCGGGTFGLGSVSTLDNWAVGESYQPFGPALAARQAMIPPMPRSA